MTLCNEFIQNVTVEYQIWGYILWVFKFCDSISKMVIAKKKTFLRVFPYTRQLLQSHYIHSYTL